MPIDWRGSLPRPSRPNIDQPEASCGKEIAIPIATLRRNKRAWYPKGPVLEIWDDEIFPKIEDSLRNRCSTRFELVARLYMIGARPETSRPTIMTCCMDQDARNQAKDLIKSSEILRAHPQFDIGASTLPLEQSRPARPLGDEDEQAATNLASDVIQGHDQAASAPGTLKIYSVVDAPVLGRKLMVINKDGDVAKGTGGVILNIQDTFYQLIAAHFTDSDDAPQIEPDSSELYECQFDGQSDEEDDEFDQEVEETSSDIDLAATSAASMASLSRVTTSESTSDLSEMTDSISFGPSTQANDRRLEEISKLFEPIGVLIHRSSHWGASSLDYALVKLAEPPQGPHWANWITDEHKGAIVYVKNVAAVPTEEREVIVATVSGGTTYGTLFPASVVFYQPSAESPQKLYTVKIDGIIQRGDSGAVVADSESGELYGHLVRGCENGNIAYIVSAQEVLWDLERQFEGVCFPSSSSPEPASEVSGDSAPSFDSRRESVTSPPFTTLSDNTSVYPFGDDEDARAWIFGQEVISWQWDSSEPSTREDMVKLFGFTQGIPSLGQTSDGCEVAFVPFSSLQLYWAPPRLNEVLHQHSISIDPQIVYDRYLRIFSILFHVDKLDCLVESFIDRSLDDAKFPMGQNPLKPRSNDLWEVFDDWQWTFFPLELKPDALRGSTIPRRCILPWTRTLLDLNETRKVYKIEVNQDCDMLRQDHQACRSHIPFCPFLQKTWLTQYSHSQNTRPGAHIFALETYHGNSFQEYDKERNAFAWLSDRLSREPFFLYDAFQQNFREGNTYYLILQWFPGDDLLTYWKTMSPLNSADDIYDFWHSFLKFIIRFYKPHSIKTRTDTTPGVDNTILSARTKRKPEDTVSTTRGHAVKSLEPYNQTTAKIRRRAMLIRNDRICHEPVDSFRYQMRGIFDYLLLMCLTMTSSTTPAPLEPPSFTGHQNLLARLTLRLRALDKFVYDLKITKIPERHIRWAISRLKEPLQARDHIFVLDNSPSMRQHRVEVLRVFQWLHYLTKTVDTDNTKLVLASDPTTIHSVRDINSLVGKLHNAFIANPTRMASYMDALLRNIEKRLFQQTSTSLNLLGSIRGKNSSKLRPISVIIFTDGKWGRRRPRAAGVEAPVQKLIIRLLLRGLPRTQLMLQFIRFGNDEDGKRHLQYLDGLSWVRGFNIADTEPVSGSVFRLLSKKYNQGYR
jgi:hypothetical protein